MNVPVLGGTGRTGQRVVQLLTDHDHEVRLLARRSAPSAPPVSTVIGDARDPESLGALIAGCHAVVSALGPTRKDRTLHRDVTPLLITTMQDLGVHRFIGISAAGVDLPGDRKPLRDRTIALAIRRLGGDAAKDKIIEAGLWLYSDLDWTLLRPPRLVDTPPTGLVDHDPHTPPRSTNITRADLAAFTVTVLENNLYLRQAPLVGRGTPPHPARRVPPRVSSR